MKTLNITYERFIEYAIEALTKLIPDGEEGVIEVKDVLKENRKGKEIFFIRSNSPIAAGTMLEPYYNAVLDGENIFDLFEEIAQKIFYVPEIVAPDFGWDDCKKTLLPKLVNEENNKEYLSDKPYILVAGLAVVVYYSLCVIDKEMASVTVTNDILRHLGVSKEELFETAFKNNEKREDIYLAPVGKYSVEAALACGADPEDPEFKKWSKEIMSTPMYVLSTSDNYRGAALVLSETIMDHISESLNSKKLAVIPSSVDEVLVAPYDVVEEMGGSEMLKGMIGKVNTETLPPDKFLSNIPYLYENRQLVPYVA